MVTVSLAKGEKRRDTVKKSLDIISENIRNALRPGMVVIKPNLVSTSAPLAARHADHIRGAPARILHESIYSEAG